MKAERVLAAVAAEYGLTVERMRRKSRNPRLVRARFMFYYLMWYKMSHKAIADMVNQTHVMVAYGHERMEAKVSIWSEDRRHWQNILKALENEDKTDENAA